MFPTCYLRIRPNAASTVRAPQICVLCVVSENLTLIGTPEPRLCHWKLPVPFFLLTTSTVEYNTLFL